MTALAKRSVAGDLPSNLLVKLPSDTLAAMQAADATSVGLVEMRSLQMFEENSSLIPTLSDEDRDLWTAGFDSLPEQPDSISLLISDSTWPEFTQDLSVSTYFVSGGVVLGALATVDDALATLAQNGLTRVANRIAYLAGLHADDPTEPTVNLDSLKHLLDVLLRNRALNDPRLTLTDDGYMHAEWPTRQGGRIVMTFLPSGLADYAAISEKATFGSEIKRVNGRHFIEEAIRAVSWFATSIVRR